MTAPKNHPPIYFDNASTSPVDPRVMEEMMGYMGPSGHFGNAASRSHAFGWDAQEAVDKAREQLAQLINADARELIFTSGATESDNLAIKGVAHFYSEPGKKHVITSKIEHKAVLDSCRQLESEGFEVTYLDPDTNGVIQPQSVADAVREDTILVSIMHANNEIGAVSDIATIGKICDERNVIFHVDAAQSLGKIPVDVRAMHVGLMSFSAHKVYGPKGIGALYVRRRPRVRIQAEMHGGGHERGMRSGTLPTHQIVGFGAACAIAAAEMDEEAKRQTRLRDRLWNSLKDMDQVFLNGGGAQNRLPGLANISFAFVEGESLIMALKDIALSSGSACTSASLEPSYVLRALGLDDELAHSSLRISMGRFTTEQEIDWAVADIRHAVEKLREMSPLWDMFCDGVDLKSVQWVGH